jgi:hypothetical protein
VEDVSAEVVPFLVVALVAGGLTMGGVTLVYFLDKWRVDPQPRLVGTLDPDESDTAVSAPRARS